MKKITVSTSTFGAYDRAPLESLEARGYTVVLNPFGRTLSEQEVIDLAGGSVGLIAGTESLSLGVLNSLSDLKVIVRLGTGMDNVDMEAAEKAGIAVTNTPDGPVLAVAELTIALALSLLRNIALMNGHMKGGTWEKRMGNLLFGKRVGIIGYGKIGMKVGELFQKLGCDISFFDPVVEASFPGATKLSLVELLKTSDIVTIHASGGDAPIIGKEETAVVKEGAWLINCSRGTLIDETALIDALQSGRIRGAALDVFSREPYSGPLTALDNVILTPHIGSYALEARVKMEHDAVQLLLAGLDGLNGK
ncbi:MAG: phosphoglycerate dehydrogenase [Deltaproteobacteria bacterium]|nr:phosphoglycerate dehydrogenase [Candidatus Zymogenaceae bacterium]